MQPNEYPSEEKPVPDCAWCGAPCDMPKPYWNRRHEPFCCKSHRDSSNRALKHLAG